MGSGSSAQKKPVEQKPSDIPQEEFIGPLEDPAKKKPQPENPPQNESPIKQDIASQPPQSPTQSQKNKNSPLQQNSILKSPESPVRKTSPSLEKYSAGGQKKNPTNLQLNNSSQQQQQQQNNNKMQQSQNQALSSRQKQLSNTQQSTQQFITPKTAGGSQTQQFTTPQAKQQKFADPLNSNTVALPNLDNSPSNQQYSPQKTSSGSRQASLKRGGDNDPTDDDQPVIMLQSLELECQIHKDQIVGICFAKSCDHQSRLLCLKCIFSQHAEHVKSSIQLKEIDDSEVNGVCMDNWPPQQICKDIRKFVRSSQMSSGENFQQEIENLEQEITAALNQVKTDFDERTENVNMSMENEIEKLNDKASSIFNLNYLRKIVSDFSESKMSNNDLNAQITLFLQEDHDEEDLNSLQQLLQQIKKNQELVFLPHEFESISEQILTLIRSIPSAVLFSNSLKFSASPFNNSKLGFSQQGNVLSFRSNSKSQYVSENGTPILHVMCVSDVLRKTSLYQIEFRVEGDLTYNSLWFSPILDEQVEDLPLNLYYCIAKGPNDMEGQFQMMGQEWLQACHLKNSTFKVRIGISNNIFSISSADERAGVTLSNYKFNCAASSSWRLAIVNNGKPIQIKQISLSIDHQ